MATDPMRLTDDGDDDDDEFANLFSFAMASSSSPKSGEGDSSNTMVAATTPSTAEGATTTTTSVDADTTPASLSHEMSTTFPFVGRSTGRMIDYLDNNGGDIQNNDDDADGTSEDSLLQLLELHKEPLTLLEVSAGKTTTTTNTSTPTSTSPSNGDPNEEERVLEIEEETDLQDLLDWLDQNDDHDRNAAKQNEPEILPPLPRPLPSEENNNSSNDVDPEPKPVEFPSLEAALQSPLSTMTQIRELFGKESHQVSSALRPHLWSRVVCGKTLDDLTTSSVADSFQQQWEQTHQYLWKNQAPPPASPNSDDPSTSTGDDQTKHKPMTLYPRQQIKLQWVLEQADQLSDRIVAVRKGEKGHCQKALASLLLYHYFTGGNDDIHDEENYEDCPNPGGDVVDPSTPTVSYHDLLVPPVACALLTAGIPKTAAAVILSHIIPNFMPILALTRKEREEAALQMHRQFYLLAAYHLPSLVMHLDRHLPNWFLWPDFEGHGPKNGQGYIPQSYLLSHMAGESGGMNKNKNIPIHPQWILALWDLMLTSSNNLLRFFMVLAVLESKAHEIVLLTDEALKEMLIHVLAFQHDDSAAGDFSIQEEGADARVSNQDALKWVETWTNKAQVLWERTPVSISRRLKRVEDKAVTDALKKRQEEAEQKMKLKMEREAKAHQEAIELERERKADEARLRLTRARLVAFYRQQNPGKETNIDKIMEAYKDRYEVLDAKLKAKYGVGFNPAIKPKVAPPPPQPTSKSGTLTAKQEDHAEDDVVKKRTRDQIVVKLSPSEVIPAVCWSKKIHEVRMTKLERGNRLEEKADSLIPLRFYIVDSRPTELAVSQGRFPTSISLPPEDWTDADRLRELEDTFEALRGAVHIVIMGEGYAALPALYGHKMTPRLSECIVEDDARNSNCALFFMKKGFPFVSLLDGGFAGAHSFLTRQGPKHSLSVHDVLADYDPEVSVFGQFERVNKSTGREKAQRALQNIFDSSLVVLTKNTRRLENLTSESLSGEQQKKGGGNMVSRFFAGGVGGGDTGKPEPGSLSPSVQNQKTENKGGPVFRNPFSRKNDPNATASKENAGQTPVLDSSVGSNPDTTQGTTPEPSSTTLQPNTPDQTVSPEQAPPTTTTVPTIATIPEPPRLEQPKNNPFAGFGAAFKQAASKATANTSGAKVPLVISNPFARFNQGGRNMDPSRHGN